MRLRECFLSLANLLSFLLPDQRATPRLLPAPCGSPLVASDLASMLLLECFPSLTNQLSILSASIVGLLPDPAHSSQITLNPPFPSRLVSMLLRECFLFLARPSFSLSPCWHAIAGVLPATRGSLSILSPFGMLLLEFFSFLVGHS
jgi:hypothetical protein